MNLSDLFSKIHNARPWQLLALTFAALALGFVLFVLLPANSDGPADPLTAVYKAWLILGFVCEGLIVDMVVFFRSRPGDATDPLERFRREARRAFIIGLVTHAGGMAI